MGFVESANCLDRVLDNGLVGDGESDYFKNLELPTDGLDFQCLEDDGFVGDWDASQWERLGPIPLDNFMQIDETLEEKQVPHQQAQFVKEGSSSHFYKIADVQESSCVFQPTSPISELESTGSCSGSKSLPIKFNINIPVRYRSKRARPSGVNRWSLIAPLLSTTTSRNTSNSRKSQKRNKKVSQPPVAPETLNNSFDDGKNTVTTKKCTHCAITKTPQWREGPNGPKTLCNACGVRYRSGRLFPEYRPAASPTFVPSIHSNSHKKVIEMRNKAKQHFPTRSEEPQMSPQPEFLPVSSSYMFDF